MRISDWSSDLCSSDLAGGARMDIALARMSYGSALMYYYWTQAGDRDTIEGKGPRNYKKVQALEAGGYKPNSTIEDGKYVDASALNLSWLPRSEEHTSELQSLMRISYAVFCLKKKTLLLT